MVTRNQALIANRKAPKSGVSSKVEASAPSTAVAAPKPPRATRKTAPKVTVEVVPKLVKAATKLPSTATGVKIHKAKKAKLVRDSFTIPKPEYLVLEELKQRALTLNHPAKKGELIRAGIKALAAMTDAAFMNAMKAVPAIKTGRPATAEVA